MITLIFYNNGHSKEYSIENYQDLIEFAKLQYSIPFGHRRSFKSQNTLSLEQKVELATYFESAQMFIDLANIHSELAIELMYAAEDEIGCNVIYKDRCASSSGKMIGTLFSSTELFDKLPQDYSLREALAFYVETPIAEHHIKRKLERVPVLSHNAEEQRLYREQTPKKPDIHSQSNYVITDDNVISKIGKWRENTKSTITINTESNNGISFWKYKPIEGREELDELLDPDNCSTM